ncbi:helix-hairpin-helix domain-containing protein [Blastococcus sp. LR1]|uniref:helix-hairpin-helix domain-containing protein n=1 Tax=Blastococcus sp. LR1 TaxID=2877000 RepID=UPI001CCAC7FB|nr:DNA-directed RNA polymerase subunit alpha C-terminal domain-containing protein [Blastococcus sp. LR1]MCA0145313.1 hypothetical protein [Blastococcus sp. LR1]
MPRKSSGTEHVQTVHELGLPGRAVSALTRAGITAVDDLAALTRAELAAVPGLGAGMVAAIRAVVPEPVGTLPPASRAARRVEDQESPMAPSIPSFASLRDQRRRSPIDLLVPRQLELPEQPEQPEVPERVEIPEPVEPTASAPEPAAVRPPTTRPPEWADLWNLGLHLARWWVHSPIRTVRRLLG